MTGHLLRIFTLITVLMLGTSQSVAEERLSLCDRIGAVPKDKNAISDPVEKRAYNPFAVGRACAEALKENPDNPRHMYQLAISLFLLADYDLALETIKQAANRKYPAAQAFLDRMDERRRSSGNDQNTDEIRQDLDPCDQSGSIYADTQRVGAAIAPEEYNPVEAEAACRKAVEKDPDHRRFNFQLGAALFGLKKPKEALPYLQKAADQNYFAAQALLFQFMQKLEDKEE